MKTKQSPRPHPVEVEVAETENSRSLILYNDDVNTFDNVINALIKYCNHEPEQAEQCAFIVHHNGKCAVKEGSYKDLKPICEALQGKGLSAVIE